MHSKTHTPSPWKVVGPSENSNCLRIFSGEEYIAIVGGSDQPTETIQANAALMAAAPEMFQIVEQFAISEQMKLKELAMLIEKSKRIVSEVNAIKKRQ
jgi:hypothetical protein